MKNIISAENIAFNCKQTVNLPANLIEIKDTMPSLSDDGSAQYITLSDYITISKGARLSIFHVSHFPDDTNQSAIVIDSQYCSLKMLLTDTKWQHIFFINGKLFELKISF